jgi:hypothetical protein
VGNGAAGQIYGVSEGEAVVTVRHPKAEPYPLKINVKVVKDKAKEKVVYLTTQRNVIETVAGVDGEQIYVQKVGGDAARTRTMWTVSDTSIVNVTENQGYAAWFQAKKEGVARIRVENEESGYPLEIVVIVKAALNNNIYIGSDSSLLWLSPGETNKRIRVELVNGDVKDNNRFIWKIENQAPGDENVAKANGKVISIVGSNEECLVNAVNEGTARIRVSNPERAERDLIITVYVSHYRKIEFSLSRKEIVMGENEFVGINLPAYEYLKDKTRVWVEDIDGKSTDICDVFYTNSLVLLSGRKEGTAVVKAALEGKEGQAQMLVSVVDKADPNINRVIAGKTMHVISRKSSPVILNASISGPNIFDSDYENIWWKIDAAGEKIIDIIPKNVSSLQARGRSIQITPQGLGTAVITVGHPYVDEAHWRQISVIVADLGNRFSVNKTDITVNSLRPETVAAQIAGGTTKDYEEVKWVAKMQQKWDGTMLEVVRIMGSGREVTLYPMNDGETEVFAFYNGDTISIKVTVVSDYYFSFRTSNEYMWPGEKRDLPFDVKPASSHINWININTEPDKEPVLTYGEVLGSSPGGTGSVNRYLQVEARREGAAAITGMANGKIASVNVIVQYDYSFVLQKNISGVPKHTNKDSSGRITSSSDGVAEAVYTIHPANTYIKPLNDKIEGLEIEVLPPVEAKDGRGRTVGTGKIRFTGVKEMNIDVEFQQYKARTPGSDEPAAVEGEKSRQRIGVGYMFGKKIEPIPYFIRGEGKYSNTTDATKNSSSAVPAARPGYNLKTAGTVEGETMAGSGKNYSLYLGDGEVHYILLDKEYEAAKLEITGISLTRNNEAVITGENGGIDINDSKFTASLEKMEINGIRRDVIRLAGGKDYIEYNRVAFEKELFLYVSSAYVNDSTVNIEPIIQPLYEKSYNIIKHNQQPVYTGPWTMIENNTANESRDFYLLRDSDLKNLGQEELGFINTHAKYITAEPWLYQYWYESGYTYYFTGNEYLNAPSITTARRIFLSISGNHCDIKAGYTPLYRYSYDVYESHEDLFRDKIEENRMVMNERTGHYVSGFFTSYYSYGGELQNRSVNRNVTVYSYEKEAIKELLDTEADVPFRNVVYDASNDNFDYWNEGIFTDDLISSLGNNYDPQNYLYSSIMYEINSLSVMAGNEIESRYNVFRSYFVDKENRETDPYGVYILPKGVKPAKTYNAGTLVTSYYSFPGCSSMAVNFFYQYFCYYNLLLTPHYSSYGPVVMGSIVSSMVEVGTNIFGANNTYGRYHRTYYFSGRHYTWPSGGCLPDGLGHRPQIYYYYSGSGARQKLSWEGGTKVVAPYYIFNRFPFRYEGIRGTLQIVKLDEAGGRPMPSIDRTRKNTNDDSAKMTLGINYTKFNTGRADDGDGSGSLYIDIYCIVRSCHSQYTGVSSDDSYVNVGAAGEFEGEKKSFEELPADDKTRKFL